MSLRCINFSDPLISTDQDGFNLELGSTKYINASALWAITYADPLWTLINQSSLMCLTFNVKDKRIVIMSNIDEILVYQSLKVKIDDQYLQLRLSSNFTEDHTLALELFSSSESTKEIFPVFFAFEGYHKILRSIEPNFIFDDQMMNSKILTLNDIKDKSYDYVVIGSSFCSLGFIHQISQRDPNAKILVLERGLQYLSEHHQHGCSSPPKHVEVTSWTVAPETVQNESLENVHGQIPLFGGRSLYWSGWCPTPSTEQLAGWPENLKISLQETYFRLAKELLNVITADQMRARENDHLIYDTFQTSLKQRLNEVINIDTIKEVQHAPLAMGNDRSIKFSTVEKLSSMKNVTIIFDCTVNRIVHDGHKATRLRTRQGSISLSNNAKLILAMSTLPATTLVLNSFSETEFPLLANVGKRFTAHFVSSVTARVPRHHLLPLPNDAAEVQLGALYIPGMKEGAQYHLQLSAVAYTKNSNGDDIHKICKKYSANSISKECIDTSQDSVIVSCSTLGELDHKNKNNQFNLMNNDHDDLTSNGKLTLQLNEQDQQLWNWMDNVTFKVMNKLSSNDDLEYWHENNQTWKKDLPSSDQIRKNCAVHDASTMWIGDIDAPVQLDYRLRGVDNVYITGGALWPTGGSWNPVVTIVAMAMHLADIIHNNSNSSPK
ncbi:unnamed protein product [Adineta ricciae]|uniref:Glucose-methanol-choline oxidoreductase C-terminal domain-containing protein n=1 Tax=Adineta ricciae TaxID=249248 RepID=A0A814RI38_ADIRI|nr:unnamed protein product [Adineta ricciae]CAF1453855.1 unnamed protein product [Adineta ricciae]